MTESFYVESTLGGFKSNWNGKAVTGENVSKLNGNGTVATGNVTFGVEKVLDSQCYYDASSSLRYNITQSVFEVGVGSNLSGRLKVRRDFYLYNLEKNYTYQPILTFEGGAECTKSISGNKMSVAENIEIEDIACSSAKVSQKLNDGYAKINGSVMFGCESVKSSLPGKIRVGMEAGYRTNLTPNSTKTDHGEMIEVPVTHDDGTTETVTQQAVAGLKLERSGGPYITPKITAEIGLGQTGFSLVGEATLNEGKAGIRYTF